MRHEGRTGGRGIVVDGYIDHLLLRLADVHGEADGITFGGEISSCQVRQGLAKQYLPDLDLIPGQFGFAFEVIQESFHDSGRVDFVSCGLIPLSSRGRSCLCSRRHIQPAELRSNFRVLG